MATTDQVVFLKSLQKYEEGLNSIVEHYNRLAPQDSKNRGYYEVSAHIYSLVRKDMTNIIEAYRHTMGA